MKANNNGWTPERRQRQAQIIHNWQPWQHSTGATTPDGKQRAKMNARRFTIMGLYRQACKLYNAKQLYYRGQTRKAWLMLLENEQYMAERTPYPTQPTPKAEYCRKRRKAISKAKHG